ncbi:coiled-coil domain-containing protein 77-like [Ruditapes philippinarum]|uniref:coiled-coil domain-containing protein 77-like n=1 Tax=Ruditapes philippinarum TaxID=129788 RepID=UPI00295C345B|nr:coiled-coil domain-containing protein 77-like [Ruditapes philippinarum]
MASASPGCSRKSSPSNSPRRSKGDRMNTSSRSKSHREPDADQPLPNINERLGHLRPSRELLEYYRKKIAEYDEEHEGLVSKLEEYKVTYEEQHKMQWELRQREKRL